MRSGRGSKLPRHCHPQFAMVVAAALDRLACGPPLLIGLTTACFRHRRRPSCAPYQFPLKSYGFSGAETARKRFLLWKMGFSAAKIAPPPPYTPPGTIKPRKGFGSTIRNSRLAALRLRHFNKERSTPMYAIWKITAHPTVDFAAEELKKYLRTTTPRCGEIPIAYGRAATDGLRIGPMQDFALDVSDAQDPALDDIVYIETQETGGIIAGFQSRSRTLIAVYRYLRLCGCRSGRSPSWRGRRMDPHDRGPSQAFLSQNGGLPLPRPMRRNRGGAEYQQDMLETIDFSPKIGMNTYMIEFDNPYAYYKNYYNHTLSTCREPRTPSIPTPCCNGSGSAKSKWKSRNAACTCTIWGTAGRRNPLASAAWKAGKRRSPRICLRRASSIWRSRKARGSRSRGYPSTPTSACPTPPRGALWQITLPITPRRRTTWIFCTSGWRQFQQPLRMRGLPAKGYL